MNILCKHISDLSSYDINNNLDNVVESLLSIRYIKFINKVFFQRISLPIQQLFISYKSQINKIISFKTSPPIVMIMIRNLLSEEAVDTELIKMVINEDLFENDFLIEDLNNILSFKTGEQYIELPIYLYNNSHISQIDSFHKNVIITTKGLISDLVKACLTIDELLELCNALYVENIPNKEVPITYCIRYKKFVLPYNYKAYAPNIILKRIIELLNNNAIPDKILAKLKILFGLHLSKTNRTANYPMNSESKLMNNIDLGQEAVDDEPDEDEPDEEDTGEVASDDETGAKEPEDDIEDEDASEVDEVNTEEPIEKKSDRKTNFKFELVPDDEPLEDFLFKLKTYEVIKSFLKSEQSEKLSSTKRIILNQWISHWIFLLHSKETKLLLKEIKIKI